MYCIIFMLCVITCMFVYDICIYACVVGRKAPESLCYLLMYINPTLNKDYLLTLKRLITQTLKMHSILIITFKSHQNLN
jgi:hypothetical protein